MSKPNSMPLTPDDLDDLDHAILDYLQKNRDATDTPWGIATPALVLAHLEATDDLTTTPVRQTVNNRMQRLSLAGHLENLRGKGVYRFQSDPRREGGQSEPTPDRTPAAEPEPEPETDRRVAAAVDAVAASWTDSDTRLHARKQAAKVVLAHAVETGDAVGRSDALDEFYPEHAVDGQDEETWWRKNIRSVLQEFGSYSRGEHGYRVNREDLPEAV